MKHLARILLALALIAGAWFVWGWLHPSPERAVRRQLEKLSESLTIKPGEGNIARVSAVNRAVSFFAPNVEIITEGMPRLGDSIHGRTELQQSLFAARSQLEGDVTFHDIRVLVSPHETNVTVNLTAVARVSNQADPYSQDLKLQFQKIEKDWLIFRVEPIALPVLPAEP